MPRLYGRLRGKEPCLCLNVVGHVVDGASEWDFSDRPWSVVGQVGGEDTDPEFPLCGEACISNIIYVILHCCDVKTCVYLFVEVQKAFRAVNVVEGGERLNAAINGHGV